MLNGKALCLGAALAAMLAANIAGADGMAAAAVDSGPASADSGRVKREFIKLLNREMPDSRFFSCELERMDCSDWVRRTVDCQTNQMESKTGLNLGMSILVKGPGGLHCPARRSGYVISNNQLNSTRSALPLFEPILDETGKAFDLKKNSCHVGWYNATGEYFWFERKGMELGPDVLGSVYFNIHQMETDPKTPQTIKGVLEFPILLREEKVTLKPLSECMDKPIPIANDIVISFTKVSEDKIDCEIKLTRKENSENGRVDQVDIMYYSASGKRIKHWGGGSWPNFPAF